MSRLPTTVLIPRPVASSVEELLAAATRREPFVPAYSRSGSRFERVEIDGLGHLLKYLHPSTDFAMRAMDVDGAMLLRAWAAGLFDVANDVIDHTVVGAAPFGDDGLGSAFLMRDVSPSLVPDGDDVFPHELHDSFIEHLARMCARTWAWQDTVGLAPYAKRWAFSTVPFMEAELRFGDPEGAAAGLFKAWGVFAKRAPRDLAEGIDELRHDLQPLATALRATPSCFLHGDWKASNLGRGADGRTVLIDWVYLGEGPACADLAWYLSLNRQKLPTSKEQVMLDFRAALEREGVATAGWWERQLGLALVGAFVLFGWDKSWGDHDEFGWWCDRAREGLALL